MEACADGPRCVFTAQVRDGERQRERLVATAVVATIERERGSAVVATIERERG